MPHLRVVVGKAGTAAEALARVRDPPADGFGAVYYKLTPAHGSERISAKKRLIAIHTESGREVTDGAAVRQELGLASDDMLLAAGDVPKGWELFIQSTSANRVLKKGQVILAEHVTSSATPAAEAAAPAKKQAGTTKRSRESKADAGGPARAATHRPKDSASKAAATGDRRPVWRVRRTAADAAAANCPFDVDDLDGGQTRLDLVDSATGKPIDIPCYGDYDVFDEPMLHSAFRVMADEACKWNWRITQRKLLNIVPDEVFSGEAEFDNDPKWQLGLKLEPYQRSFKSAADCNERRHVASEAECESDGSYVEVWLRGVRKLGAGNYSWGETLVLAQFGDQPLHVSCCGHPLVETRHFSFLNSDGSSQLHLDPFHLTHPLVVIAHAEMFCVQQVH
eukprot:CAMPEP_0174848380 /NCGR_PEP_ID=MMETSP1114-20130205/13492_1 /TAXON_ID=312471 /ORGANISM="Neobodo designis, Strain CCAP 1951/1" /LENGTH=393 /DNA_ID=CAMNT_0016082681 /DNA_START=35 /DNA_END=1216 /DNA_ORIENTATION=+